MVAGMRASTRQLLAEVGDVAHDVPVFLTAPLYRRWHRRWGATAAELAGSMPGDELLPHAQFRATRAIMIDAPPRAVWPWLVQVGALRAGWYSNDLLDNLGRPSATTIVPDLQHLEVGQWLPMAPSGPPSDRNAFRVHSFEVNEWLLWTKPDSTWAWRLTLTDHGTRRSLGSTPSTTGITRCQPCWVWCSWSSAISPCNAGCCAGSRRGPRRSSPGPARETCVQPCARAPGRSGPAIP
jgi:hypothetical protein